MKTNVMKRAMALILAALIVLVVFAAIVGKGIYNRRHGKGGCSCGGDCGACGGCHCGNTRHS